ncbi:helix-turn-helix domain-containing protein [Spongiactinospora sp. 9N601]|uniref:helix-turn-helix domain-containing protein n=1 Tax=Spongiactinospora sp. 9N601 TaxID=3375149 RepID=UPI0037AFB0D8
MNDANTGGAIRRERERRRMSTTALATRVGCTVRHIELVENGQRTPSLPMLREIAKVLGVRTAILVGEPPRETHQPGQPQIGDVERALFAYRTMIQDVEPPTVEQLAQRVAATRASLYSSPHRYTDTLRVLPDLIVDTERLVRDGDRAAFRVAADAYDLTRGLFYQLSRVDLAYLAADRGVRYAEESGDPLMIGLTRRGLAAALLWYDMPQLACETVLRGIEDFAPHVGDGDQRHIRALGGMFQLAAVGLARTGEVERGREMLRTDARRLAQRVDGSEVYDPIFFSATNVAIHVCSLESDVRNPRNVLRYSEDVDIRATPSLERRATHLSEIVRACEDTGDDAGCLLHLMRIEHESPEDLDHRILLRESVQSLLRRAKPSWATEVRRLAERHAIPV